MQAGGRVDQELRGGCTQLAALSSRAGAFTEMTTIGVT
jgi:hypothetical protein